MISSSGMTRISEERLDELILFYSTRGSSDSWESERDASTKKALRELRAYRKEGWVLVPKEPTDEMEVAAMKVSINNTWVGDIYRAMLAAAPEPQEEP